MYCNQRVRKSHSSPGHPVTVHLSQLATGVINMEFLLLFVWQTLNWHPNAGDT